MIIAKLNWTGYYFQCCGEVSQTMHIFYKGGSVQWMRALLFICKSFACNLSSPRSSWLLQYRPNMKARDNFRIRAYTWDCAVELKFLRWGVTLELIDRGVSVQNEHEGGWLWCNWGRRFVIKCLYGNALLRVVIDALCDFRIILTHRVVNDIIP